MVGLLRTTRAACGRSTRPRNRAGRRRARALRRRDPSSWLVSSRPVLRRRLRRRLRGRAIHSRDRLSRLVPRQRWGCRRRFLGERASESRSRKRGPPRGAGHDRRARRRQEAADSGDDLLLRHRSRGSRRLGPAAATPESRHAQLGDVHHPRLGCRGGAALRRADAAESVVPHDCRLPDPSGDAAPAGAGRTDRGDPARSGMAEEPERLVQPDLQHL